LLKLKTYFFSFHYLLFEPEAVNTGNYTTM